ncbi:MAG TPA: YfjI family protein [Pseudomonas sp.]|nr:YfjI family protein [Pseudomonas sp.]
MSTPLISEPINLNPIPLLPQTEAAESYPTQALGRLLGDAVSAITSALQVPDAIAAQSVLTAAAMAAQPHGNVVRGGQRIPLSLNGLTVAESGDRKSATDKLVLRAHIEHQQLLRRKYKLEAKQFKNHRVAYQKAQAEILAKSKAASPESISADLSKINEPVEPSLPMIFSDEPTIEGLQKNLLSGNPSQGLFNDEGGQFFGGFAFKPENTLKSISVLSKLWDGAPITRIRAAQGESLTRSGCRLSAHLMIQPVVAQELLTNPIFQGQGFLARFLIAWPPSIAGTRLYRDVDPGSDPRLVAFWERMGVLLAIPLTLDDQNELSPPDIELEPEALSAWISYHDEIEQTLGKGGEMQEIKPTAAKSAENALRIAGVMAVTEDSTSITLEIIKRATVLSRWYLTEALRIAYPARIDSQLLQAQHLLDWLMTKGWGAFDARSLQREGPSFVRKSSKQRDLLLAVLAEHRWLSTANGKDFRLNSTVTETTLPTT